MKAEVRLRRTPPERLAGVLRAARLRADLGLREAARSIGITSGYLAALEGGHRCPSRSVADLLATVLNLDDSERGVLFSAAVTDAGRDHPLRSKQADSGRASAC